MKFWGEPLLLIALAMPMILPAQGCSPAPSTRPVTAPAARAAGPLARELWLDLGDDISMKLVLIPAGKFMMGSSKAEQELAMDQLVKAGKKDANFSDEGPQHEVTISKPFYMGQTPVTQSQWTAVMGTTVEQQRDKAGTSWGLFGEGPDHPIYYVSWQEAAEFCNKLSQKTGRTVSLPTEAQWEYACRAGSTTRFSYGDDNESYGELRNYAWYDDPGTHLVGLKKPNDFGLYDMHGHVWQWCSDWWDPNYYASSNTTDPQGPASGKYRVLRGGASNVQPQDCRSACRGCACPDTPVWPFGFRVVVRMAVDGR